MIQPEEVVYLLTPTSNHNLEPLHYKLRGLYIFWLLHQTTTLSVDGRMGFGCISFDSYIKPQLGGWTPLRPQVVYLLTPTSNHNLARDAPKRESVVYLLTPTSNHNFPLFFAVRLELYIFWLLHQTTTVHRAVRRTWKLYIFWLLHQTTTRFSFCMRSACCISFDSYIKPQLKHILIWKHQSCISFDSYIKPQPIDLKTLNSSA